MNEQWLLEQRKVTVHSDGISVASSGVYERYVLTQQREAEGSDNDVIPYAVEITQRLRVVSVHLLE